MVHLAAMVAFSLTKLGKRRSLSSVFSQRQNQSGSGGSGPRAVGRAASLGVVSITLPGESFIASEKDRRQWVLDQKRVEWKGLLQVVGSIRTILLPGWQARRTGQCKSARASSPPFEILR